MGPEALQLHSQGALGLDFWSFPYVLAGDPVLRHSPGLRTEGTHSGRPARPPKSWPRPCHWAGSPFQQLRLWALLKYTFIAFLQFYKNINK